jgi:two-component system CheB/CheR fusion protein
MDPQLMDGHPPLSVLVVDDHPDSADILALLVKTWGHDARSATSGDEALALAAEFRPQVALLDLAMPGLNGFEVARRMRQTAGAARPLLIAVSGDGRPQEHSQADEAGFTITC